MSATPAVTVLMPVYNAQAYLDQAITSVLDQSLKGFEFLIIDDGSTDKSREIISTYTTDPRIRLVKHKRNRGLVACLNLGIRQAKASLVARMDADDISLPHRLQQQLTFLNKNPRIAAVGGHIRKINESGTEISVVKMQTNPTVLAWQCMFHNPFAHPSVMFRKQAVLDAGGYNPAAKHYEDRDLWWRLSQEYSLANVDSLVLEYRVNQGSISQKHQTQQRQAVRAFNAKIISSFIKISAQELNLVLSPPQISWEMLHNFHRKRRLLETLLESFSHQRDLSKQQRIMLREYMYREGFFSFLAAGLRQKLRG